MPIPPLGPLAAGVVAPPTPQAPAPPALTDHDAWDALTLVGVPPDSATALVKGRATSTPHADWDRVTRMGVDPDHATAVVAALHGVPHPGAGPSSVPREPSAPIGAGESFANAALDMVPFGSKVGALAGAARDKLAGSTQPFMSNYDTELNALKARVEAGKQQHPAAHYLGDAAGIGLQVVPGVLGAAGAGAADAAAAASKVGLLGRVLRSMGIGAGWGAAAKVGDTHVQPVNGVNPTVGDYLTQYGGGAASGAVGGAMFGGALHGLGEGAASALRWTGNLPKLASAGGLVGDKTEAPLTAFVTGAGAGEEGGGARTLEAAAAMHGDDPERMTIDLNPIAGRAVADRSIAGGNAIRGALDARNTQQLPRMQATLENATGQKATGLGAEFERRAAEQKALGQVNYDAAFGGDPLTDDAVLGPLKKDPLLRFAYDKARGSGKIPTPDGITYDLPDDPAGENGGDPRPFDLLPKAAQEEVKDMVGTSPALQDQVAKMRLPSFERSGLLVKPKPTGLTALPVRAADAIKRVAQSIVNGKYEGAPFDKIDAQKYSNTDGTGILDRWLAAVKTEAPDYAQALEDWAQPEDLNRAEEAAKEDFASGKIDEFGVQQRLKGFESKAERDHYIRTATELAFQRMRDQRNTGESSLSGPGDLAARFLSADKTQQKFRTIINDPARYEQFLKDVQVMSREFYTRHIASGNSITATAKGADAAMFGATPIATWIGKAIRAAKGPLRSGISRVAEGEKAIDRARAASTARAMAPALVARGAQRDAVIQALIQRGQQRAAVAPYAQAAAKTGGLLTPSIEDMGMQAMHGLLARYTDPGQQSPLDPVTLQPR